MKSIRWRTFAGRGDEDNKISFGLCNTTTHFLWHNSLWWSQSACWQSESQYFTKLHRSQRRRCFRISLQKLQAGRKLIVRIAKDDLTLGESVALLTQTTPSISALNEHYIDKKEMIKHITLKNWRNLLCYALLHIHSY